MNFLLFNVILLLTGFGALFAFTFGLMACLAPLALFAKWENPPKVLTVPFMGIGAIYQIYFWGFWSAFCVAMVIRFTQKPEVTWDWAYWIAGFMECTSLIGWLAHKERQSSRSLADVRKIEKGTMLYSLVAIAAFLVFAFVPSLASVPYGWALKALGMEMYITEEATSIRIDEVARKSVDGFFAGYEHAVNANKLATTMSSSKDPLGDFEMVKSLFNKSKEQLAQCDKQVLNRIYNGWGDVVSDKLIPAIDFFLAGVKPKGDRTNLARGDALMSEFNIWLQSNRNSLLLQLHERYGYAIK